MSKYSIEYIVERLKKARREKGLSQRALGKMIGVPQSHISKIENGLVDLQTSSLVELSRVLDLELLLVPRILVPTILSIQRTGGKTSKPRPMYRLDEEEENEE
jgi:HTH-type transcriptional regulator / antitoxin HipB